MRGCECVVCAESGQAGSQSARGQCKASGVEDQCRLWRWKEGGAAVGGGGGGGVVKKRDERPEQGVIYSWNDDERTASVWPWLAQRRKDRTGRKQAAQRNATQRQQQQEAQAVLGSDVYSSGAVRRDMQMLATLLRRWNQRL
ncbi:unnamed protein product [Cercospora beticola]|nr:unnamed protein product [Cercospora beticola]